MSLDNSDNNSDNNNKPKKHNSIKGASKMLSEVHEKVNWPSMQ